MTRWVRRGICVATLMGLALLGNSVPAAAADDIVIGFSVALSGPMQAYDGDSTKMAKLFIDQTNAKGGLLGRKLRAVDADTKSDRAEGAKAGLAAVQAGAVLVFATCDYDYGAPAALQAQRAGVISVFLCAEDPKAGILGVGNLSFTASRSGAVARRRLGRVGDRRRRAGRTVTSCSTTASSTTSRSAPATTGCIPKKGGKIVGRDTFKERRCRRSPLRSHGWPPRCATRRSTTSCSARMSRAAPARYVRSALPASPCRCSAAARWTATTGWRRCRS